MTKCICQVLFDKVHLLLSLCQSVSLSLCLSVSMSRSLPGSMSLCLRTYMSLCLSASLSFFYLRTYVRMSLCLSIPTHVPRFLSAALSVCLYLCLSVSLSRCLSLCLSVCNEALRALQWEACPHGHNVYQQSLLCSVAQCPARLATKYVRTYVRILEDAGSCLRKCGRKPDPSMTEAPSMATCEISAMENWNPEGKWNVPRATSGLSKVF